MSIHVTVNGNPVYLNQRRVLLTDVETAKKNEWLRRRKIRLQQARQQAKDLSQNVRKKVCSEKSIIEKHEKEKYSNEQDKKRKEKLDCLQREYAQTLSSVGSGHQLAVLQNECEALNREKQELREEIARTRGAIAEEKLKAEKLLQKEKALVIAGRKQMSKKVENLRSTLVSNLPSVKSTCSSEKKITVKAQVHRVPNVEDDDLKGTYSKKCQSSEIETDVSKGSRRESLQKQVNKSSLSDGEECNEESDEDSDVTWPPRSAKVIKESIPVPRVRFYDHVSRISKEWPKPSYTVTHENPFCQPDMIEAIAEEEEAFVRKENLDTLAKREKMIRGNRALRKEREKKEADRIIKEIDDIEKRRKIQTIINRAYPSHFHSREHWREENSGISEARILSSAQDKNYAEEDDRVRKEYLKNMAGRCHSRVLESEPVYFKRNDSRLPNYNEPPGNIDSEEVLENLISKLKDERANRQKTLEKRFGVEGVEEMDIPMWIPEPPKSPQPRIDHPRLSPERVFPEQNQSEKSLQHKIERFDRRSVGIQNTEYKPTKCPCSSKCSCCNEVIRDPLVEGSKNEMPTILEQVPTGLEDISNEEKCDEFSCGKEPAVECKTQTDHQQGKPEFNISDQKDLEKSPNSPNQRSAVETLSHESLSTGFSDSTSQADTLQSSLTYEGVKVVVKVSENKKKRNIKSPAKIKKRDKDVQTSDQDFSTKNVSLSNRVVNEGTSSSTSYLSPPSRLSPAHQSLIRSVLKKIESRTKNPQLHAYIQRLLDMSHERIEKLPVSSVSDVSISSSIFNRSGPCTKKKDQEKYDVSCQAGSSLDENSPHEEALKFSELAKCYADRVNDLASMIDALKLMPIHERPSLDDETSYLNPPEDHHYSFKLSNSVQATVYPRPLDISDIPTSIQPHPRHLQPPLCNGCPRRVMEDMPHNLSTIQESETLIEKEADGVPRTFDPDISSIRGSPQKNRCEEENNHLSAGSSLCLLDDKDISSFLGSSSDDFEDVFRNLGIAWALPTVRKTRESRKLSRGSSSSSGRLMYSHSTPLGQSPVKGSIEKVGPPSAKQGSSIKSVKVDTDSLTPPSFSLNIPRLSQYLSPSSNNKY